MLDFPKSKIQIFMYVTHQDG